MGTAGAMVWFIGLLLTYFIVLGPQTSASYSDFIKLPPLLYIVLGWPTIGRAPMRVVSSTGVLLQLWGLLMLLYQVAIEKYWSLSWIADRIGLDSIYVACGIFAGTAIVSRLVIDRLLVLWPYH